MNVNVNNKSFLPANLTAQDPTNASDEIVRRMHRQWCVCTDEGESVSVMGRRGDGGGDGGRGGGRAHLNLVKLKLEEVGAGGSHEDRREQLGVGLHLRAKRQTSQSGYPLLPPRPNHSPPHTSLLPLNTQRAAGGLFVKG